MSVREDMLLVAGVGVAALLAIAYLGKKGGQAAVAVGKAVGQAVNPVSDQNIAYKAASAVGGVFADYPGATLGTMFADTFKPSSQKAVDKMLSTVPAAPIKIGSYYDLGAKLPTVEPEPEPAPSGGYYDLSQKLPPVQSDSIFTGDEFLL